MARPVLKDGSFGADVGMVQECLGVDNDLDFGPNTEAAVRDFQQTNRLDVTGVVDEETWTALEEDYPLPEYPPPLYELNDQQVKQISDTAAHSEIASYYWHDRGKAPLGYTKGIAVAFAIALLRLRNDEPLVREMARAVTSSADPDEDALAWYEDEFTNLHMSNREDGVDTLRHLFVLIMGLGMRESSGYYCEGRDMSADNVSAETAEAGLFQMSWNAEVCSTSMQALFAAYDTNGDAALNGYEDVFSEGVSCSDSDWENYGSGDGAKYQWMAKHYPLFAVETVAIGLRSLRQHWGPINRKEVELKEEANNMLLMVQELIYGATPPPAEEGPPDWLLIMRAITGLTETPGDADNPKILAMPKAIARIFPDMADYCALYQHDATAWCGVTAAFCMALSGIRPPFGPTDTDKWMWALSWADPKDAVEFKEISEPRQGCVVVMEREGGGHVTFFEEMDGENYLCRGGNQSDSVNVQSYSPGTVVALMWPQEEAQQRTNVTITIDPPGSATVSVEGSA